MATAPRLRPLPTNPEQGWHWPRVYLKDSWPSVRLHHGVDVTVWVITTQRSTRGTISQTTVCRSSNVFTDSHVLTAAAGMAACTGHTTRSVLSNRPKWCRIDDTFHSLKGQWLTVNIKGFCCILLDESAGEFLRSCLGNARETLLLSNIAIIAEIAIKKILSCPTQVC